RTCSRRREAALAEEHTLYSCSSEPRSRLRSADGASRPGQGLGSVRPGRCPVLAQRLWSPGTARWAFERVREGRRQWTEATPRLARRGEATSREPGRVLCAPAADGWCRRPVEA